jgi:hypothetical protein
VKLNHRSPLGILVREVKFAGAVLGAAWGIITYHEEPKP